MDAPRQKVGQYLLQRKLGEGGMGAVFLGEHEFTGRQAAIKMINGGHFENEESIRRLKDEARALGKISHPNIVNVLDFFSEQGAYFLVLEFVNGASLDKVFQVSQVNLFQAVDTAIKAGQGIAAAHAHGILHRDIKPQNVMVGENGEVKLMDFGLAKFADATSKTRTGVIMGTPRYMSPEQCRGSALDERSDLYSFGVLLYRLVAGREPFIDGDAFTIAAKHVYEKPPAPEEFNPGIPAELSRIILKSMEKDPGARYPDMNAMLRELEGVREMLKAESSTEPAPLTATLALTHIREALAPGGEFTPGPRTPSGLRFTGVERVDSGARPGAGTSPFTASVSPPGRTRRLALIAGAGVVLALGGWMGFNLLRARKAAAALNPAAAAPGALPPAAGDPAGSGEPAANRWVRVNPPPKGLVLTLGAPDGAGQSGFRSARNITAPQVAYEIQQHEVSWGELDPWLASHLDVVAGAPAWLPADPAQRANFPVTGLAWADAQKYCKTLGGALPTEEQWEFAARGWKLSPAPWGTQRPDAHRMRFYAGAAGRPEPVMSSDQDRTPGAANEAIFDLAGNVQEWTVDLWRDDNPGQDESWVQEGQTSYRAIRGLPLTKDAPADFPPFPAALREPLCASGVCLEKSRARLQSVGFRCARDPR